MASDDADLAMAAMARVQEGLRALADGDEARVLRTVNEASDDEARWMISSLYAVARGYAELLASKTGKDVARLLAAGADGMDQDIVETGAAAHVAEIFRREGWDSNG